MSNFVGIAADDLWAGLKKHRVWRELAKEDIADQHRMTLLGPLWLLVSYCAFAGTFIFLFHPSDDPAFPAYVAVGLLVWFYIMEVITQAIALFRREASFINGTILPLSIYVYRLTTQSVIRLVYALVGCIVIVLIAGTGGPTVSWTLIFGIAVVLLATPAAIIVLAFIGTYFPDSQFLISNLIRLGMFITPIFWKYEGQGGIRGYLYQWNPFTYFLEIIRRPVIEGVLPTQALAITVMIAALLWVTAFVLLGKLKHDVPFRV